MVPALQARSELPSAGYQSVGNQDIRADTTADRRAKTNLLLKIHAGLGSCCHSPTGSSNLTLYSRRFRHIDRRLAPLLSNVVLDVCWLSRPDRGKAVVALFGLYALGAVGYAIKTGRSDCYVGGAPEGVYSEGLCGRHSLFLSGPNLALGPPLVPTGTSPSPSTLRGPG